MNKDSKLTQFFQVTMKLRTLLLMPGTCFVFRAVTTMLFLILLQMFVQYMFMLFEDLLLCFISEISMNTISVA